MESGHLLIDKRDTFLLTLFNFLRPKSSILPVHVDHWKFAFLQGWLGPTTIGDLPPAECFSNNLNISNQRQPDISAQNEKSDFSRGIQDILTDRVYQLPRKAFKLPFLERQNKNNQNSHQASDALRHQRCIRCTWDAKMQIFCAIFFAIFLSSKWFNAYSEEPHCSKFKKPKQERWFVKIAPKIKHHLAFLFRFILVISVPKIRLIVNIILSKNKTMKGRNNCEIGE